MTAKELEDLNVAKTNRVVVNEMEGKKRMFSARYLLFSSYHVEYTRSLHHICSSEKIGYIQGTNLNRYIPMF